MHVIINIHSYVCVRVCVLANPIRQKQTLPSNSQQQLRWQSTYLIRQSAESSSVAEFLLLILSSTFPFLDPTVTLLSSLERFFAKGNPKKGYFWIRVEHLISLIKLLCSWFIFFLCFFLVLSLSLSLFRLSFWCFVCIFFLSFLS